MLLAHIDQWILEEILIALRADYNAAAGSGAKGSIQQQACACREQHAIVHVGPLAYLPVRCCHVAGTVCSG